MRQIAQLVMNGEPPSEEQLYLLRTRLRHFSSWCWNEQRIAVWALGRAVQTKEQQAQSVQTLQHIVVRRSWASSSLLVWLWFVLPPVVIAMGLFYGDLSFSSELFGLWFGMMAGLSPLLYFGLSPSRLAYHRLRAMAVMALGQLPESSAVATLAAAVYDFDTLPGPAGVQKAAAQALPPVLATLTTKDYDLLPAGTIPALCRLLKHRDERLVLNVLKALAKVGDGSTLAAVEKLTIKGRTEPVRNAAQELVPLLRQRHEQENAPTSLLRASQLPEEESATLLRPPASSSETNPDQLLRATYAAKTD
jgi:hypothetical protein